MSYVLIVGAKSDIAMATARKYAENGYDLYLAARNSKTLDVCAQDIRLRHQVKVQCLELDIIDYSSHQKFYDALTEKPLGVISAVGYLGDQNKGQTDWHEANMILNSNYTGIVSLFNIIANDFSERRQGFIVGISSVAGDRGRKSNYLYGAAKAAFTTYMSGLRNRLYEHKVHVLTVKPGFVETQMTKGMDLPALLTVKPNIVASAIYNGQLKGKDIIYSKGLWQWIMLVIKAIPEWKFKKMSLG